MRCCRSAPIRATASQMNVLSTRRGRHQRGKDAAEYSGIASPPASIAAPGLRFVSMKERHLAQIGEDSPTAAPRSEGRKYSVRAVTSGGEITKETPPMWRAADLVRHYRFSSPPQLSTPAWRQQSRLCRNGSVAQLFGRPGSPCRLSREMPPRKIRGHSPKVALRREVSR